MFLSMLSKLPPGVCWRGGGGGGGVTGLLNKGGGSNRLPGVVTKQQAVEFPQVQTSTIIHAASPWQDFGLFVCMSYVSCPACKVFFPYHMRELPSSLLIPSFKEHHYIVRIFHHILLMSHGDVTNAHILV